MRILKSNLETSLQRVIGMENGTKITQVDNILDLNIPDLSSKKQAMHTLANIHKDRSITKEDITFLFHRCLLYTSPSPRDRQKSRMPSSA